ncbi:MAG: LPXTG cell wall anchor domain-containing protein [Ilumatobacteraceae bacterium]
MTVFVGVSFLAAPLAAADDTDSGPPSSTEASPPDDTVTDSTVTDSTVTDDTVTDDTVTDDTVTDDTVTDDTVTDDTVTDDTVTDDTVTDSTVTDSTIIEQTADVTSAAIAVADTGHNATTADGTSPDSTGAGVDTGSATATGSVDRTTIDQQATTHLTDDATADIVQYVIVFNVGGSVATSGSNAAAGVGSGATTTGDATAIGNDGVVGIVQASGADAAAGESEGVDQRAVTVRIGVSVANSGANAPGAAGSSGTVVSGDATAIGNDATTDVRQIAVAIGDGTAVLSIDQRAIVMNVGLAWANTGANGMPIDASIAAAAGAFVSMPDHQRAVDLVALLLPSLLSSGGAGSVTTGDATAVGNQSTTAIAQHGAVTATGDGVASIDQHVAVANVGVAIASTGGNGTGATSPGSSDAAVSIAAFLTALMADLQRWDGTGELLDRGLALDIGGRTVVLDGRLAGELLTGDPNTPQGRRTIRQLSAGSNLGVAKADSGNNTTAATDVVVIEPTTSAQAGAFTIATGDARSTNVAVVLVCQRHDRPDVACPAPPGATSAAASGPSDVVTGVGSSSSSPPVAAVTAGWEPSQSTRWPVVAAASEESLPATGTDASSLTVIASLVSAAGAIALRVSRRPADGAQGRLFEASA